MRSPLLVPCVLALLRDPCVRSVSVFSGDRTTVPGAAVTFASGAASSTGLLNRALLIALAAHQPLSRVVITRLTSGGQP